MLFCTLFMWIRTLWLLFSLTVGGTVSADTLFLGVERSRIEKVIELGYGWDPTVEDEIRRLASEFPDSPVSGVLEAGYLYWIQNYAEWDEASQQRFEERAEVALKSAEAYLKEHKDDPDAQFAVALVELMQVIYYVDHRRWWAAFWKSGGSLKTMRRLVDKYPYYHDAKMPLGMANCYLSKTPGYLKPLAFLMRFKGDWELGIEYLEAARDKGLFLKVDAGYHLSAIRMELVRDRQASRDEMARLAKRFPGNLRFRSMLAELERGLGNQKVARDLALEVLEEPRLEEFPAIEGRTLTSLLWSSLGAGSFELAMTVADQVKTFGKTYPIFEVDPAWSEYVRAEALWGLGEHEAALELWRKLANDASKAVSSASQQRLQELER